MMYSNEEEKKWVTLTQYDDAQLSQVVQHYPPNILEFHLELVPSEPLMFANNDATQYSQRWILNPIISLILQRAISSLAEMATTLLSFFFPGY